METAINLVEQAYIFIIIGTSLNVYPAASLIDYAVNSQRIILIDKSPTFLDGIEVISEKATQAVPKLVNDLLNL